MINAWKKWHFFVSVAEDKIDEPLADPDEEQYPIPDGIDFPPSQEVYTSHSNSPQNSSAAVDRFMQDNTPMQHGRTAERPGSELECFSPDFHSMYNDCQNSFFTW